MEIRCVYILKGERYYVGSTNDIERRIEEHKKKGYTAKRIGNRELVKIIGCENRLEARRLEMKIKKGGHPERRVE